jgi:hypothetical protein
MRPLLMADTGGAVLSLKVAFHVLFKDSRDSRIYTIFRGLCNDTISELTILSLVGVTLDGDLDLWLDLMTTLTHNF